MADTNYYIGTAGWRYGNWKGLLYPVDLPSAEWLHYYAGVFNSLEVNSTFYHFPRPTTLAGWRAQVPASFMFSLKLPRYFTHDKRLAVDADVVKKLQAFCNSLAALEGRLGSVLVQLPPNLQRDDTRLTAFVNEFRTQADQAGVPLNLAMEVRNASWYADVTFASLLKQLKLVHVINDSPGKWPSADIVTGGAAYIRLHGNRELYKSEYTVAEVKAWAERLKSYRTERAFVYFDNTMTGAAVTNAKALQAILT